QRAPDDKPMHLWTSIVTDQMFASNSILVAERKAAQGTAPVYRYKVDWESPVLGGKLRSPHAVEIPFVFDTVHTAEGLVGNGPEQDIMAKAMSQSFAAFARHGDPNTLGLPHWPPYSPDKRQTLIFDVQPRVVADPDSEVRTFWQRIREGKGPSRSAIKDAFDAKKFESLIRGLPVCRPGRGRLSRRRSPRTPRARVRRAPSRRLGHRGQLWHHWRRINTRDLPCSPPIMTP